MSYCSLALGVGDSPVSNGGRGLKLRQTPRRRWACEDSPVSNGGRGLKPCTGGTRCSLLIDSPVSNGGRGLKLQRDDVGLCLSGFARQQWRAWIETFHRLPCLTLLIDSPVSNGGRGLKLAAAVPLLVATPIRPSAMAGVD